MPAEGLSRAAVASAGFLSIPCTFPDLRDDRRLQGAVRHAVERQLHALETQKEQGAFVHGLIEMGQQLLRRVRWFPRASRLHQCSAPGFTGSERGRVIHQAELTVGSRLLHLWLTALPMATAVERIAVPVADALRRMLVVATG